jgi:hypothetical protein
MGFAIVFEEFTFVFVILTRLGIMFTSFVHSLCRSRRNIKASSISVAAVYHNYPSPTINRPGSSFGLDLASTEAVDGMEATQE